MFKKLLIILVSAVLIIVFGLLLLNPILNPEYKNKDECKSNGTLELLCGLQNPEDFAEIPGENAVIVSQFSGLAELNYGEIKSGTLSRLDLETREIEDYQIRFEINNNLGIGEESCEPYEGLHPHGIDIYQNISIKDETFSPFLEEAHLLAVVNHESVDRIEFFLFFSDEVVFSDSNIRELFWVGCVEGPKNSTYFNDVVISDENGSFYATHQYDKDWGFSKLFIFNIFRWDTGYVYKWSKELGYSILNNSSGAWPNGIEMIDDTIYVSFRMNGSISAIKNSGKRKNFKFRSYLDGGSDNIIAKDEELWIAVQDTNFGGLTCMEPNQIQCATPFSVIRADAELNIIEEFNFGDVSFGGLSVVYPYNDELFLGSYKSDRIAIYNANDTASTKLYILGTGTPNPNPERAGSSYLLLVKDTPYLIDFGSGVVRRVAALTKTWGGDLEINTENLEHAFLTHMHSDHNLGLADLIITPWIMGREHKLVLHGPKALNSMAKNLIEAFEFDINYRINGTQPQNNTGYKYDFNEIFDGYIYEDNLVKVEAFKNSHGDLEESYGFVFETPHKKIVFSGDTAPSEKLLLKAKGADILIHEVYSQAGFEKKTPDWQIYHAAHHTSPEELGRIASKIKPKKLILSHILFWGAEPEDIKKEVQLFYDGEVIVAEDLLLID